MTQRIAIIGGGITGLAAALHLLDDDATRTVVVFEQDAQTGGKLQTELVDGFLIEGGPDAFLASKPGALELSQRLALEPQMISPIPENRQSFVMNQGQLLPLPQGLSGLIPGDLKPIFQSPLLSRRGKARLAMEYLVPRRKSTGDESIAGFMRRRYGVETWERMMEPLLTGIYGGDGDRLGIAGTFPNLPKMESQHRSLLKGAIAARKTAIVPSISAGQPKGFLSFKRGMGVLTDTAARAVIDSGGEIRTGSRVTAIARGAGGVGLVVTASTADGTESGTFDGVIMATPAWVSGPLLAEISPAASLALSSLEHSSSGLVALAFPTAQLTRPLKGYGYVVPRAEGREVTAMTWASSKWPSRAPEGHSLVRVFLGRSGREEVLKRDDADLVELAIAEMGEVLGQVVSPSLTRVARWQKAMPQYLVGHLDRVVQIEQGVGEVPGLAVAGTMLRGVGVPDSITSAEAAANKLIADFRRAGAAA